MTCGRSRIKTHVVCRNYFFHQFRINQENCHLNAKVGIDKKQNRIKIFFISKWVGCSRRSRVEIPKFSCNPKTTVLNCSISGLSEKEISPAGMNVSSNNNIFSVVKDDRQTLFSFIQITNFLPFVVLIFGDDWDFIITIPSSNNICSRIGRRSCITINP